MDLRITGGAEGSAPPLLDGEKQVLTFNLKKEWYEKIKCGDKTIEYREAKPYWEKRFAKEFCSLDVLVCGEKSGANFFVLHPHPCVLRLGYTKQCMTAKIVKVEWLETGKDTDLAIDAPVYAIHLADVREGGRKKNESLHRRKNNRA